MKKLLLSIFILSTLLTSCGVNDNTAESETTINIQYEGDIVLNTSDYLVTESEDNYILYDLKSSKRLRKFLDFGEVKYADDGVIKSRYVFLQKTFAYILEDGMLTTHDFGRHCDEVSINGNFLILSGVIYTGDFRNIGYGLQGEITEQTSIEDGGRLTMAYNPPRHHIESVRAIKLDTKPNPSTLIYESGDAKLYYDEVTSELTLENPDGVYLINFSISGSIRDIHAIGNYNHNIFLLCDDNGQLKNYHINNLNINDAGYLSAKVDHIIFDGEFFGKTISLPWVLDENGEILLRGNGLLFCDELSIDELLVSHYPFFIYETDMLDYYRKSPEACEDIMVYDKSLNPINTTPSDILHICGDNEHFTLFNYETKEFTIISESGEIVYKTDHVEYPLMLDGFGAAVLTKSGKVQFITCDGTALDELDGWHDGMTIYTPRQNYVFGDTSSKPLYYFVAFDDPTDTDENGTPKSITFRYYPESGECDAINAYKGEGT